jgi:DivIVA domain-containing protein
MELTPQLLDEQEFPVVLRGYDTDAVDDFLERVGAGVAALLDRMDQARRRLVDLEAEVAAAKAAPPEDPVERQVQEVSRTLVLAQEAADKALSEAKAEAAALRDEATAEADRTRRTARTEADEMVAAAHRDVEDRKASAAAEIDAHAALRRVEREDELSRLAAQEDRARADLQRLHEKLEAQRKQLSSIAAAAGEIMQSHDLEPVTAPQGASVPAAVARADDPSGTDERSERGAEDTAAIDALTPESPASGDAAPAAAAPVRGRDVNGHVDEASEGTEPAAVPEEADVRAPSGAAAEMAPSGGGTGVTVPQTATPGSPDNAASDESRGTGGSTPPAQGIPPSPPPRSTASLATSGSAATAVDAGPAPALAVAGLARDPVDTTGPAVEGTTFYRPDAGGRGLFDQDDDLPPVSSPPRLRSVAPPDDDPFLAALRGDDQAAALLNEQPQSEDDNPTGLMRLLRRR